MHQVNDSQGNRRAAAGSALLLSCALAVCGCRASFELAPAEVSRLVRGGTVRALDGEQHQVPDEFEAVVVTRRVGGRRLMVPEHGDGPVVATPVPDAYVPRAEAAGLSDDEVRIGRPIEAGVGPMGSGLAASRGDALPPPPPGTSPVLWLRNEQHRIVELELAYVKHIEVNETEMSGGAVAGIVVGSIAGGALLITLITYVAVTASQIDID